MEWIIVYNDEPLGVYNSKTEEVFGAYVEDSKLFREGDPHRALAYRGDGYWSKYGRDQKVVNVDDPADLATLLR